MRQDHEQDRRIGLERALGGGTGGIRSLCYAGVNRNNTTLFSAWRLNSQTGALEFCTYDPGGVVLGTAPTKETLLCTAPVKPLEVDN
jgi:hypothetical protein